MPLELETPALARPRRERADPGAPVLTVALVNNMPDAALQATQAQFSGLLAQACGARAVRLRCTTLSQVPRGAAAREHLHAHYWDLAQVLRAPLDGVIVTGTEPRAAALPSEPYWAELVELVEFVQARALPSVWSCLAAHAAVQHLDRIERARLPDKRCGVYDQQVRAGHPLAQGLPGVWATPQSRWNELPLRALEDAGYTVLSSSPACGADVFVRDAGSPMVFLQGHPEYDQRTLLKEYRRDVLRCLGGEQPHYPTLPVGCFDAAARAQLEAFAEAAQARPRRAEAAQFPYEAVARGLTNTWRAPAARLYSNWLESLAALPRAARVGPDNDVAHRDDPAGHAELIELTDFNDLTEIT